MTDTENTIVVNEEAPAEAEILSEESVVGEGNIPVDPYSEESPTEDNAPDTIEHYVADKTQCTPEYVALVESSIWIVVRLERDKLLSESDWSVMADSPLSTEKQEEWKTYRQSLRDIPQGTIPTIDEDQNIVEGLNWPSKPI